MSNPIGRPSKYDPKYCDEIVEFMSQGYSIEAFAGLIGVTKSTLYLWIKEHPEFSDAKTLGEAKSQLYFERIGNEHLVNVKDGPQLNTSFWIFNMKNRFKWRDNMDIKSDVTFTDKDAAKMTKEQLIEEAQKLITELKDE